MAEIIEETVVTEQSPTPVVRTTIKQSISSTQTAEYVLYYILGALEVLLAFRLVLKLTGASMSSGFVNLMYTITSIFILPFEGIFRRGLAQGIETTAVFEPSTVVAMIVYGIAAWGIVALLHVLSGQKPE